MTKATTDDQSELFTQVDVDDNVIGPVTRAAAHADKNIIHRTTAVLLTNDLGEMLFQKRSLTKDTNPGFWSCSASGHVSFGDEYESAANREMIEEIGLNCPVIFAQKIFLADHEETEFAAIFTADVIGRPEVKINPTEVTETRWIPIVSLKEFVAGHSVTYATKEYLKALGYI